MLRNKLIDKISSLLSFLPDKHYSILTFLIRQRRFPNLKNPTLFNDKLLYLKLTDRNPLYKQLVDKYEVRNYVKNIIGEQYLIPLIGVYRHPSEVDFDKLPNKFVIKSTSGSGGQNVVICKNKDELDWSNISGKIEKWLKYDTYKRTREWPYKDLPSRIVIEEYIEDSQRQTNDYKFWCFNGEPFCVQVHLNRFKNHQKGIFDLNFNNILFKHGNVQDLDHKIKKPKNYETMIKIAKKLSQQLPFVRVDLYNIDGKIYFGEMTLYPANCNYRIRPFKYEKILGKKLIIE